MLKVVEVSLITVQSIRGLLEALYARIPLKLSMVTTVNDDEWTVVYAHDRGYNGDEGTVLSWQESFCCRMMRGDWHLHWSCHRSTASIAGGSVAGGRPNDVGSEGRAQGRSVTAQTCRLP